MALEYDQELKYKNNNNSKIDCYVCLDNDMVCAYITYMVWQMQRNSRQIQVWTCIILKINL